MTGAAVESLGMIIVLILVAAFLLPKVAESFKSAAYLTSAIFRLPMRFFRPRRPKARDAKKMNRTAAGGQMASRDRMILGKLHPLFLRNGIQDPEVQAELLLLFLNQHEKDVTRSDSSTLFSELSDKDIDDFTNLLKGIYFPIHPDEMERANKFGCEICRDFYLAMWGSVTAPIIEDIKSGRGSVADHGTSDEKTHGLLTEAQEFLDAQSQ